MIDLGPHALFILGAYGFVAVVCLELIVSTWFESKRQKARLRQQEILLQKSKE